MGTEKHVLFVTREIVPFYYGGIGTLFKATAKLLREKGARVSFLTQSRPEFDARVFEQNYGAVPVHFVETADPAAYVDYSPSGGVISTFNLAYAVALTERFDTLVAEQKPDLVILPDFGAEGLFLLLKSALGFYPDTRFLLHLSGGLFDALSTYEGGTTGHLPSELVEPQNRMVCAMEDCCVLLAGEIIAPTAHAWESTSQRLGLKRTVHVIPNYPDMDFFHPDRVIQPKDTAEKLMLFIGRLDRHKGADILLQLFIELQEKQETNLCLVFLGRDCFCKEYDTTFIDYWQDRIPDNCRDKIVFTGQVDHGEVVNYLGRAALCVFPSRWEVFGLVCLEAMSYGVPVLVAADTGLEEVLGEELARFAFDFSAENERFFATVQSLCDASGGMSLRNQFKDRAGEIISDSGMLYEKLVENGEEHRAELDGKTGMRVFEKMFEAVAAVSDISRILSYDVQRLKEFFQLDEDVVKTIIRGKTGEKMDLLFCLRQLLKGK
jgi:glycosyltransferase involved in cell wall biosynthesis